MRSQRAGGATAAVIGVVALLVVVLVGWYFISDTFRTKVDATADQMTKWTPENIAKDPVNYLNFCEQKTKQAIEDLKADRIAVEQNRAKLQSMRDTASNKVNVGRQALVQLVDTYKRTDSANVWPVAYEGSSRDKDWFKTNIVSLNKQVETQRTILTKVEAGLKKLDAQVVKIEKAQAEATTQLAEIGTNRELLKVQKLTDDLKDRLVSMKGALQGVVNTASETGATISLDQLAAESTPAADTAEFDKILNTVK
jgi:chromosome segregation ATPase